MAEKMTWRKFFDEYKDEGEIHFIAPFGHLSVLDEEFDAGYGGTEGPPVTIWTDEWVYFPACYDGAEWLARVPRNPQEDAVEHVGGG